MAFSYTVGVMRRPPYELPSPSVTSDPTSPSRLVPIVEQPEDHIVYFSRDSVRSTIGVTPLSTSDTSAVRVRYRLYHPAPSSVNSPDSPPLNLRVVLLTGVTYEVAHTHLIAAFLSQRGCTVLTFDRYGHGQSDAVDSPHTPELMANQLHGLLQLPEVAEHFRPPFALFGLSLGGAIALAYTACHPTAVSHLLLVTPQGMRMPVFHPAYIIAHTPLLGIYFCKRLFPSLFATELNKDRPRRCSPTNPYRVENAQLLDAVQQWIQ